MPFILSASIESADFSRLGEQINEAQSSGIDWVHVDVMDGQFVPHITMGQFIVKTCRRITNLPIDVHLMVEKPENQLQSFAEAGANNLLVHVETCPHIFHTLQIIRSLGCRPGVVLNPGTPANSISEIIHLVDIVLIMTVNPGASGQKFLMDVVSKIEQVDQLLKLRNHSAIIEIDGGVDHDTLPIAYHAGARAFVSASAIFKNPEGINKGIQSLRSSIVE